MWWAERDPALRSDFTNVTLLDHAPDPRRLEARVIAALTELPRLHQRVVAPPVRIQPPEWRDAFVDIGYHLRRVALAEPRNERALFDYAAEFASDPLDRSRPLWQFVLVEGLDDGRAALLQKMHHTITDGVGGLRISLVLLDPIDGRPPPEERLSGPPPLGENDPIERVTAVDALSDATRDAAREGLSFGRRAIGATLGLARHPTALPTRALQAWKLAGSVRRQMLVVEPGRSPLFANRSVARRFEALEFEFEPLKLAAKHLGASFNDVFVAGVTAALGRYHSRLGQPVASLRMAMPVYTGGRGAVAGANSFAPTRVLVSTRADEMSDHVALTTQELTGVKHEPVLNAVDFLATLAAPLPTSLIAAALRNQASTIDFATSNLKASPIEFSICGARVLANFPFGPRTGTPLNITMFTYANKMGLGMNIDPAAVTDVPLLVECVVAAFDELAAIGRSDAA